ncbi:MAG: lipocalin family protein [Christiangramia sp.]|nr:lipocalin family protein [Christiangramia sp.]
MKKILILFLSLSLFAACSEDDSPSDNGESIIGTWVLVEANNVPGFQVDECSSQSTITFMADNTASSTFYGKNSNDECVSSTDAGAWSKSDSKYTFKVPQLGTVTGTVTFSSETRFTFRPDDLPTSSLVFEMQ